MRTKPEESRARLRGVMAIIAGSTLLLSACSATGAASSGDIATGSPAPSAAAVSAAPVASTTSGGGGRGDYSYGDPSTEAPSGSPAADTESVAVNVASGPPGRYLTGPHGLTLYTFEPDGPSTSTCDGGCAEAWPPFTVDAGVELTPGDGVGGDLTTFLRTDGALQVAYDGAPLYYFANDTVPGDTNGQGLGDDWFVAEP